MEELIFDRTQLDLYADTEKSYYNYSDLNRIETWCEHLANILNNYSYSVNISIKTNWEMRDFPAQTEIERIRDNINTLKQAYFSFTQIPENLELITIEKANAIEKILHEIDKLIKHMENNFIYSGVSMCGQNRVWQQRFRRKYVSKTSGSSWDELKQIYWNEFNLTDTWKGVVEDETDG